MRIRPINIARKLHISTTTLRHYEERELIPPVPRSASGYREYTEEHVAYFVCIREMLPGFSLTLISEILKHVLAKRIESGLWIATKTQANLHREQRIADKIAQKLLDKNKQPGHRRNERLTIHDVSRETGVPASTIRYWDKVGLLSVDRNTENNYRIFTGEHIEQILTIYALKFSVYSKYRQHSVEQIRMELQEFDPDDGDKIAAITTDMRQHLDRVNRLQIKGISALYHLCVQVETHHFDTTTQA